MPTENSLSNSALSDRLQRMETSIEELNTRIARLAIALGVSLDSEHEVQRVMTRKTVPTPAPMPAQAVERRTDRRETSVPFSGLDRRSGTDRRLAYKWEELRGLLVLRYGVEKTYVEQVGLTATRHIMVSAEQHMTRGGFRPGADGLDLKPLLDDN